MARAQCLLINDLKILLVNQVHAGQDYWCLPGGGVETHETPEAAARRELKEECNLVATELRLLNTLHYSETDVHYTFLVTSFMGDLKLGHDPELPKDAQIIKAVAWKHVDDLSDLDRYFLVAAGALANEPLRQHLGWLPY